MSHIKKHLQQRTIQPSADAWNTLDKRLTDFEKTKKYNYWPFLRYAAAILMVASIGFYFYGKKEKELEVVEQPVLKLEEHKTQPIIEEISNGIAISEEEKEEEVPAKTVAKEASETTVRRKQVNELTILNTQHPATQIAVVEAQNFEVESLENQKIKEVIALVETIKSEKGEITELEIEQLLTNALKSSKARKGVQDKRINSADLLADIEYDLDKDFKNRLFEAIVKTLKEPKHIIVNR